MVKSRLKSLLPSLLIAMMVTMLAPLAAQAQDVTYLNQFGESHTLAAGSYTTVTYQVIDWSDGWYVVSSDVTFADTCVTVIGTVHLVLADGATLTVHKGITLEVGNELDIYCQSGGTGALTATSENAYQYHAGIGGREKQSCGKLVINGGVLNIAPGEFGAGIGGGGNGMSCGDGGDITINGGSVTVTTNNPGKPLYGGASAIGGGGYYNMTSNNYYKGSNGGTLTIHGGNVHLTANEGSGYGSAVGPGYAYGHCKADATLILDWSSMDDRIYMSKVKANVTMNAPFKNAETGEEVTASDNLNGITLAPLFVTKYTVSFMLNGEEYDRQIITENHVVEEPDAPNIDGWLFLGWFEDGATEPYDFSTPITGNLTLYAHMVQKSLPTDGDGAYLIGSALDWRVFIVMLSEGIAPSNATAKLTADITEPVTYMMETTFSGTFDGQGHTITLGLNITENMKGLFCSINGATITNLTVAGTINTSAQYTGGLIGTTAGSDNYITDCVMSATMNGTFVGSGKHGGFLGNARDADAITFTNCVFEGNMYGPNTKEWSGFIGYNSYSNNTCYLIDCFVVPGDIDVDVSRKGYTFCSNPKPTRCYYTYSVGYNPTNSNINLVATITAGERVILSDGTPTKTYKNVDYYASPARFTFDYDLPEDKIFFKYSVNTGELTAPYMMTGQQSVRNFDGPVVITGAHLDSLVDIASGTIDPIPDKTYTGKAQTTALVVTVEGETLVPANYSTAYENNVNAGEATVTLTGRDPYTGTLVGHFNILPRDLSADGYTFTIHPEWGHTGEVVHPKPKITHKIDYSTTYTLVEGVDYELTYSEGCIESGQYTVTINGIGNYTGTHDLPFEILGSVNFLNYDSENDKMVPDVCENYQLVMNDLTELTEGWYVAKGNVTVSDERVIATGDVHLILMDGATYKPRKGITVSDNSDNPNSLTTYAQSEGEEMGQLVVDNAKGSCAGIGGERSGHPGIITINGGHITTTGSSGAGIGSGYESAGSGATSCIYIHGGIVDATGGSSSAGIGGSRGSCGRIFITGGTVNATGYQNTFTGGAGIGGGGGWPAQEVNISGGTVVARGGWYSPGIGGGANSDSQNGHGGTSGRIRITGGDVTALTSSSYDVAIGEARYAYAYDPKTNFIELSWTHPTDRIEVDGSYAGGDVFLNSLFVIDGTSTLATLDNIGHKTIVPAREVVIDSVANGTVTADKQYVAYNAENQTVTLTVTPNEGYVLTSLNVVEAVADTTVTLNKTGEGSYTFEMPMNAVTVTATFEQIPDGCTLAEALEGEEGLVLITSDMKVMVSNANYAVVTDGSGNWLKVSPGIDAAEGDVIGNMMGTISGLDLNPVIASVTFEVSDAIVDAEPTQLNLTTAHQDDVTALKSNEVAVVLGYYNAAENTLRAFSPGGKQGMSISLTTDNMTGSLTDGQAVTVKGVLTLKEAWDAPSGAPARASKTDNGFQNYTMDAIAAQIATGINTIKMLNGKEIQGVYNLNGQQVRNPESGVYIIRFTDGTSSKVRF
ncbi:MAG: InlB B-repeat-containing protein [Muribaculaceae bacterium]|nr:InlB B-repeat-containing protein [Muribaculaceae bacterium]